jgi:electron transport complex protein RnfB
MTPNGATPVATKATSMPTAERVDALLPQTQCTRCGYPNCREYAEALVHGRTELNRCPPGGAPTIAALAAVLGRRPMPLDPACGRERPWVVARIDESACIGCTLCIQACPVDAILGAAKRMHTVIEDECTGCELCIRPCPVDCIVLAPMRLLPAGGEVQESPVSQPFAAFLDRWMAERSTRARRRFRAREQRLPRLGRARAERRRHKAAAMPGRDADRITKQAVIRAAVERARQRRDARDL